MRSLEGGRPRSCVWWLLLVFFTSWNEAHECIHWLRHIAISNLYQPVSKVNPSPIRITLEYSIGFEQLIRKQEIIDNIIEPAVNYWRKNLKVKVPLVGPLLVEPFCKPGTSFATKYNGKDVVACKQFCGKDTFPEQIFNICHLYDGDGKITTYGTAGSGVPNTDIVIFIKEEKSLKDYSAKSEIRVIDRNTSRPVLGVLTLYDDILMLYNIDQAIITLKHEIAHILAFSVNLYAFYVDENGIARTTRDQNNIPNLGKLIDNPKFDNYKPDENTFKVITKTHNTPIGPQNTDRGMLTTPKILGHARTYFGCPSLEGVSLEDYPENKISWSHLEKRFFYNNLMTSSILGDVVVTEFELSLMEDSGWYLPTYTDAIDADFGKKLGCDFINLNCFEYLKLKESTNSTAYPFCYQDKRGICNDNSTGFIQCISVKTPDDFSEEYLYFKNKENYFPDPYTEYCPMFAVRGTAKEMIEKYVFDCQKPIGVEEFGKNLGIYVPGNSSACVSSPKSGRWKLKTCYGIMPLPLWAAFCHKFNCSKTYGLSFQFNDVLFQCLYENQLLTIETGIKVAVAYGALTCPKCSSLCSEDICNGTKVVLKTPKIIYNLTCPQRNSKEASSSNVFIIFIVHILFYVLC